jgi:uncharacterized protein (DUF608 family)
MLRNVELQINISFRIFKCVIILNYKEIAGPLIIFRFQITFKKEKERKTCAVNNCNREKIGD